MEERMTALLAHIVETAWTAFLSPDSLFWWPYVALYLVITLSVMIVSKRMSPRAALREMFTPRIWLTKSAVTDVVVSLLFMILFKGPIVAAQIYLGSVTYDLLFQTALPGQAGWGFQLPAFWEGLLLAVVIVLCFDLATYWGHRLMHAVPVLWDVHRVHHSPEALNLFSAYRQNPLDYGLRHLLAGVFTGAGVAAFHCVFPQQTSGLTIMGVGAGFFVFMLTVHLQHSHVPVHYPRWLRPVLLSPHLHQIHHSRAPRHHNKNFTGIFAFWDILFGTYLDEEFEIGELNYGLDPEEDDIHHSVLRCFWSPFFAMGRRCRRIAGEFRRGTVRRVPFETGVSVEPSARPVNDSRWRQSFGDLSRFGTVRERYPGTSSSVPPEYTRCTKRDRC